MHDDRSGFKPPDPGRIHALDPLELEYWCKELDCTERELMAAIEKVGEHVAEVRQALKELRHRR
jgi:hypothetical protein